MESSVKPQKKITQCIQTTGQQVLAVTLLLLKMLRQGKQPFLPDSLCFSLLPSSVFLFFHLNRTGADMHQQAIVVADTFYRLNLFPFCGLVV